jgi:hypothetical protein
VVCCAQHISLDPGLRRDDEQKRLRYAINYLPDLLMVLGPKTWGCLRSQTSAK